MQLVDLIEIDSGTSEIRRIELLIGDLVEIPNEHGVDVLVVSAFPNDYLPTPTSLIGALAAKGLSVAKLARSPEADLRDNFSCWLSRKVAPPLGCSFHRVLCFEPLARGSPPELVGDIFRALAPFVYGEPLIRSIAMPVVAAGDQGYSISTMLPPMLEAAVHWLAIGFPLSIIKLVVRSSSALSEARPIFEKYREQVAAAARRRRTPKPTGTTKSAGPTTEAALDTAAEYDVFISYARHDKDAADHLTEHLGKHGLRVFLDRTEIKIGASWQQKIFDSLEGCSMTAVLYSPDYLQSKNCKEEFNISWAGRREFEREIIFPLLIRDAALPTYMRMLNYVDCRINDKHKIAAAADMIASTVLHIPTID
jgi:hypothetical protein